MTPAPPPPPQSPSAPWPQDEDCVGQQDPMSAAPIPNGQGFRLEAENRCYSANTLARIELEGRPLVGPMTQTPFTVNDKRRLEDYINNPNTSVSGTIAYRPPHMVIDGLYGRNSYDISDSESYTSTDNDDDDDDNDSEAIPWSQDADCVDQEDPVSLETIPDGQGFRLQDGHCYDVKTLVRMKQLRNPLIGPMSRKKFTDIDKKRIRGYMTENPIGGKKRRTYKRRRVNKRKTNKKQKNKKRKTRHAK